MANNGITGDVGKTGSISDSVKELVDAGQERIQDVKERVLDAKDRVVDKAESMGSQLTRLIQDHPLKAVGVAFGIGYLGMRIFRR